ncbi:C-GCAxxG-C-C family (seleno)protein [Heliophilum fasciatum]|uniref:C_GCAxxG_C_C family probable redox protein n=1 Tax=Heliophilum fasciatum TaxID=35700 RepID=A0A4R2RKK1_9FIRM|nr:C-GCAxxG-C-C family (seleno)protein [Heliophilum fasciatum]MCW2278502.1 C_GCAxxG_C_C family probable redox protein [Heliophilum fasciatum]TCP63633.1 C_GCAxxG_C_C family probable redox protein [Heliophilum fasciatum]
MGEMSNVVSNSLHYFRNGLYCSEAILKAFNEEYDLGLTEEYLKIATSFGVGIGASKCLCGAISGGVLVISLLEGRAKPSESEGPAFSAAAHLHKEFLKDYKSSCCRVLTRSVEWGTPDHHKYCEQFVQRAAELTEEVLKEKLENYRNHRDRIDGGELPVASA